MKTGWRARLTRGLSAIAKDRSGSTTIMVALALPVVIGSVGVAVDFALAAKAKSQMQAVADAAALSAAREFQMARSDAEKIAGLARDRILAQLPGVAVQAKADTQALVLKVTVEQDIEATVSRMLTQSATHVRVTAEARMTSGLPVCLLALDEKAKDTIKLEKNARMSAPGCVVQSNSKSAEGLSSKDDAVLQAGFICSAGGKVKTKNTNYTPEPTTDCPVMPDPLASRSGPTDFACSYTNQVIDGITMTLQPGVYCGGLRVTNGAQVTLKPGIFVVKDGPLLVDMNAALRGTNVAIYLRGAGANLTFETASTIDLTAPKDGLLSGILIFDDPTGAPAPDKTGKHPKVDTAPREHSILSDNARNLLGTIYMPHGRLIVDATKPIADKSAYTVMVVKQIDLFEGPNLVLNTDYAGSDIPVPQGVGPYGGKVLLSN